MEERINIASDTVIEFLEQKRYSELKELLNEMLPADIALLFEDLDKAQLVAVFRLLTKDLGADTFAYLDNDSCMKLLDAISDREIHDVFGRLFLDDAVDVIGEMPANVVTRILNNSDPETRHLINEILKYPEDSAGSIMTVEYVNFTKNMSVGEAIAKLRREGTGKETVYTCYVTENRKLIGIVDTSILLASDDSEIIENIMETNVVSVNTLEDREVVTRTFNKYGFIAVPIVDADMRLVGIVTVDDAIEVMQQENTEDISIMAVMEPIEAGYFKTSVFSHAKKRIVWLLVLMISSTVTGMLLQKYESAISVLPVLVSCIPMLMGTGGNSGTQAATMMIRGIALDEVRFSDIFRVVFKEFRISIIVSAVLSAVNFARILIMYYAGWLGEIGGVSVFIVAFVVSAALMLVVIAAKFIGCTLPLLAHKVGLDPALMASAVISTIVDAFAVVIYFNIAVYFIDIL